MPLVIDNNTRSWESFDVQTASTLYWKALPVLVKQNDREEQTSELTVRILSGVNRNNHNSRILRIHLSSDEDLFFLHTLEVSEEEFQSLKVEQGILVDFGNFPGKVITLLQKCILAQSDETPRFQAVLSARGSDSIFKIVETNDFNQLPHITLAFRPGNDVAVKQFLAFRLSEVKLNCEHLTADLNMTMGDRDSTQIKLEDTLQQLTASREMHERTVLEQQAHSKTKDAIALEEKTKELAQLKATLDQERERLEVKYREQMDALASRTGDLDTENRQLRGLKYELDTKVSELSHKLGTAEGNCRSMEEELSRLQSQHIQLSKGKSERDVEANELQAKLRSADEKVQAQREHIAEQNQRCRDLEASTRQLDERCSELKESAAGHELRAKEAAAEVLKGNRIIEKVSNDLRMAKEKAKRKQAIIGRQEEELAARDSTLNSIQKEQASSSRQTEHLHEDNKALKDEISSLKSKLEDCKGQLQSNEQMIRWLNNQVNEAQLQFGGTAGGSRYSFKPAALRAGTTVSGGSTGIPAGPSRSSVSPPAALNNVPYISHYTPAASHHVTPSTTSTASRTNVSGAAWPSAAGFASHQMKTPGTAGSNSASILPTSAPLKLCTRDEHISPYPGRTLTVAQLMVRFKNRYLLFEILWKDNKSDDSINEAGLLSIFRDSLASNFGDHGFARCAMSLSVKYYNPVTNLCVLRCGTEDYRQVWCAMSMITEISSRRAMLHFLHFGGTLKSCQQAAIDYNTRLLKGLQPTYQQTKALLQAEEKLTKLDL